MDLSKLTDADLEAMRSGDLSKVSDAGLSVLSGSKPVINAAPAYDPTESMSGFEKFAAGTGKAVYDAARGVGNIVTDIAPSTAKYGFATRKDTDESNLRDAALMKTGAGMAGNVFGNVATYAPLALIPGGATIGGGALIGAASGAAQPVGAKDSRLGNAGIGFATGAAMPAAIRTAKALRAGIVDPFTTAGRDKIAGNVIKNAVNNPADVAQKLQAARGNTPGFIPTVGQAAGDDGAAALERTMRAIDPSGFNGVEQGQRSALAAALRDIAGTPEARTKAVAAREAAAKPLYDAAKQASVQGDAALESLMQRPSMQDAAGQAAKLAAERGEQFAMSPATQAQNVSTGILDASGNPMVNQVAAQPANYKGNALHDLKMGLDLAIGSPGTGGMQGAQRDAALGTKEAYVNWLRSNIPEYGQAMQQYAEKSKPINQMDIGKELYNRFVPALADTGGPEFRATAQTYAKALREGDQLARNVTGMKSIRLADTMTPEQMMTLEGVAKDAATKAAAETAGRGVGSDTVQKISMSNIAQQAGVPNWMASIARVPGGWAKRAGDIAYGNADDQIRSRLAELLRDPQAAAKAMQAAGATPSEIAKILKISGQGMALSAPASINAAQQ